MFRKEVRTGALRELRSAGIGVRDLRKKLGNRVSRLIPTGEPYAGKVQPVKAAFQLVKVQS